MPPLNRSRKRDYGVCSSDWVSDDEEEEEETGVVQPQKLRILSGDEGDDHFESQVCIGSAGGDARLVRTKLLVDRPSTSKPCADADLAFDDHDALLYANDCEEYEDDEEESPIQLPHAPSLSPYEVPTTSGGPEDSDSDTDDEEGPEYGTSKPEETKSKEYLRLEEWKEKYRETYLREMIWLEGRGRRNRLNFCTGCGRECSSIYRCTSCIGAEPLCKECTVAVHHRSPFHSIETWNGSHYEHTTLKALGLFVQLGHPPNQTCENPLRSHHDDFVVIDTTGIHEVSLAFCGCDTRKENHVQLLCYGLFPGTAREPRTAATFRVLKFFEVLCYESKGSHEEFYRSLVRLSDNVTLKSPRDRYHEFMEMVSQWRHLKMLKRAGRGHDRGGIGGTKLGSCAVRCPACPQPGINLPEDWEEAPPGKRWIYRLYASVDGNFKLKRRLVSSDEKDPGLNQGWAYFVENGRFKKHLQSEWNSPQDRSTCVAHDAVDKPDRQARGLAVSGVIAIVCTRHEFRLPNGVGDLQRGERYHRTDFVVFSGIRWFKIRELVISYDIACQWHKKLFQRIEMLPIHLRPTYLSTLIVLIPKFHLPAHVEYCNRTYSFNLTKGVGRTDGEAPERGWSRMNTAGKSTTEMGPGRRRDTLDGHMSNENWDHTKRLPSKMEGKMQCAVEGKAKHAAALVEYQENIPKKFTDAWVDQVERWEANPSETHNSFEVEVRGISEQAIRLQLAQEAEAAAAAREGKDASNAGDVGMVHPSLFISSGIQLEEDQYKLRLAASGLGNHPTKKQLTNMAEKSNTLRRRIAVWTEVQKQYIPDADKIRRQQDSASTSVDGKPSLEAYEIPLLLPSSLPLASCSPNLIQYEARLREGQAYDALNEVRRYLRLRSYLYKKKDANSRGVAANTRSNTAIKRAQKGVDTAAIKYTQAYAALVTLCGKEPAEGQEPEQWRRDLRVLKASHIRGLSEGLFGESEGTRGISWIWKSRSAPITAQSEENIESDEQLQDALRVEFLKACARALRWEEEVELLEEEMRRTLQFFTYKAEWWFSRQTSAIGGSTADYDEGFAAYALSQCSVYHTLRRLCQQRWEAGKASNWVKKVQKGGRKKAVRLEDEDD